MGYDIFWGESLPCMPHVLLRTLESCLEEPFEPDRLAHWIRQDVVTLTSILQLRYVSDSKTCDSKKSADESLEQTISRLGLETVRSRLLQLATRQISQRFNEDTWQQFKQLWLRALSSARLAKVLAMLVSHHNPDECYQAALLQDLGQLIQQARYFDIYRSLLDLAHDDSSLLQLERERLADDHCQVAGQTLEEKNWPLDICDAIRFHHENIDDVQDAQSIVKIVNVASLLSAELLDDESKGAESKGEYAQELASVEQLLGIQTPLLLELIHQVREEVSEQVLQLRVSLPGLEENNLAPDDWSQELEVQRLLADQVTDHMQYQGIANQVLAAESETGLLQCWLQGLCQLYQATNGLLFIVDQTGQRLEAESFELQQPLFSIAAEPGRSLVSDCFCQQGELSWVRDNPGDYRLTVVDKQIARYLDSDNLWFVPLRVHDQCLGVAVLAVSDTLLPKLKTGAAYSQAFARSISELIPRVRRRLAVAEQGQQLLQQQHQRRLRETLHEVNNPLTIVSNYLHSFRFKRPDDAEVQADIEKITHELQRASALLEKLKLPVGQSAEDPADDVHHVISVTTELINQSLLEDRGITLQVDNDNTLTQFQIPQLPFQQILTNLLKNAAEALLSGGTIRLAARTVQGVGAQTFAEIEVSDNGPGLPVSIQERLFQQVVSTKSGHAGLGLQIVKQLVDELNGMIFCRTSNAGTQFQILLPINATI